ncbi:putative serine/threonine-protein kinase [Lachnellula willkommii]|uniref:Putative serine/threonine-protein kinase n=1 Tax=Lachnellula willkommii TaxID=215461 RepID=A0A559MGX1_9HELO|nr:putative serine/threonine-protein kinase [Lachnellula willkommii]
MSIEDNPAPDYGDFVCSDDEFEVEDLAEPRERYFQGLPYYPICIGDVLDQRYRIEHKLGHGGYSTVWVAHDMQTKRDVALKIHVPGSEGENELKMQNEIIRNVQDTSNLLTYESSFYLRGYDSQNHLVLVFPIWGPSFGSCMKQMSTSAHLNNRNVMWGICLPNIYDTDTKYKYLGRPQKIKFYSPSGSTAEIVKPIIFSNDLLRETVCLGDFGHAIKAGTSVTPKFHSPVGYCAPELFHDRDPSFASDIWSYMCLFSELYFGFQLFWKTGSPAIVSEIVNVLGPLPEHWKGGYKGPGTGNDSWYDQSRVPSKPLAAIIKYSRPEISDIERSHVLSIMSKGLCYLPESRISAEQLQQDASFKAIMEIHGR